MIAKSLSEQQANRVHRGPFVSVISIFFNAEDYLAEAIESVIAQHYGEFELLLCDDGSTDRSAQIAADFARRYPERVTVVHHPGRVNRGMSATRNLGVRHARGELIAFIDADDRWRPGKLRGQVAILERCPDVDVVGGAVNYWRSWDGGQDEIVATGHVQDRRIPPPEASLWMYPLGRGAAPCPSDLLIRRQAINDVGGFEESFTGPLQMYEDQAFLAKLYLQATAHFASECWLDYRRHDRSCSEQVGRDGRYDEVRRHFLEWFRNYLDARPHLQITAVMRALDRASLPYRRPHLGRPLKAAGRLLRKLGMA